MGSITAIPVWDKKETYRAGAEVFFGASVYRARRTVEAGRDPATYSDDWTSKGPATPVAGKRALAERMDSRIGIGA